MGSKRVLLPNHSYAGCLVNHHMPVVQLARVLVLLGALVLVPVQGDASECVAALAVSEPVAAVSGMSADSPDTYWGPLPAPSDSTIVVFPDRAMPLWEKALYYPYRVVSLPVDLTTDGLTEGIIFLYEASFVKKLREFSGGFPGPFGTRITPNVTAGDLLGYGGGLSISHEAFLHPGHRFKLRWQSTANSSHKLTLGLALPAGRVNALELGAGYRVRPNARYFGLGPFAREGDESYFTQELFWAGMNWNHELGSHVTTGLTGLVSTLGNRGPGVDKGPSLEDRFKDELPFGYGRRSDGLTFSLELAHDSSTENGRPERGGLRRLKAAYFIATGGADFDFWTYRAEVQQFLPLWFPRRVLAIRGFISWIDGAGRIPFQRLLTNDEPDLLRGFRDFRWRGRGIAALTAEYRWPIWTLGMPRDQGVDAYLFADFGQVFEDADELARRNLTESYGGGIRLIGFGGLFAARFEVAWSGEETVLRLRGDQVFQFAKGGLYHGRDPIPSH
jgi:hypothetical protein